MPRFPPLGLVRRLPAKAGSARTPARRGRHHTTLNRAGHSPLRSIAVVDPHLSERRSQLERIERCWKERRSQLERIERCWKTSSPRAVRTKSVLAWLTVSCIADGTRRDSGGRSELFWRGSPFSLVEF